jgi:prefoldin subunit 1
MKLSTRYLRYLPISHSFPPGSRGNHDKELNELTDWLAAPAAAKCQKLMQEIEARATFSQQQLQIVKSQMAAKQRDIRLLQLTSKELDALPTSTKVYEGVGKMYGYFLWHTRCGDVVISFFTNIVPDILVLSHFGIPFFFADSYLANRFVLEDLGTVQKRLDSERKSAEGDIKDLQKKYTYLETTFEKTQENLNQILNRR